MSRGPDYQKREAKRSLWDMDGEHSSYRNKGRGRGRDKKLTRQQFHDMIEEEFIDADDWGSDELEDAWLCYKYSICPHCYPEKK